MILKNTGRGQFKILFLLFFNASLKVQENATHICYKINLIDVFVFHPLLWSASNTSNDYTIYTLL